MRVLVVEDDLNIAKTLKLLLSSYSYAVDVSVDAESALQMVEAFTYDLVLLDVVLPGLDGISLCQTLRTRGYQMPILLLTGQDSGQQKALALNIGADDYVVKPFDAEELVARLQALLRRGRTVAQPILQWGELQLDPSSRSVFYGTALLTLTPKEYAILTLLLRNPQRVLNSKEILEHAWTAEECPGEETVRVHIKGLRQKLKAVGAPSNLIETVYRVGYRLRSIDSTALPEAAIATPDPASLNSVQYYGLFEGGNAERLQSLQSVLTPYAIQLLPLSDRKQIWETLEASNPAFLLLEVEPCAAALIQLCQDVRHHSCWQNLPIIALLPKLDLALVSQLWSVGITDFVSQSTPDPELVVRILSRLPQSVG